MKRSAGLPLSVKKAVFKERGVPRKIKGGGGGKVRGKKEEAGVFLGGV